MALTAATLLHLLASLQLVLSTQVEWAGSFDTPDPWYTLQLQATAGRYPSSSLQVALLGAEMTTADADSLLSAGCASASAGASLHVSSCYELSVDSRAWISLFHLNTTVDRVLLFADESLIDFGGQLPLIVDEAGDEVDVDVAGDDEEEPEEEPPQGGKTADWGNTIGGVALVFGVTVTVNLLLAIFSPTVGFYRDVCEALVLSLAGGALMGTSFYLYAFQSSNMLTLHWSDPVTVIWRWGTMVLTGYTMPIFLHIVACALIDYACCDCIDQGNSFNEKSRRTTSAPKPEGTADPAEVELQNRVDNHRVVTKVIISDVLHRLADGFSIAGAFMLCDTNFGWLITATAAIHETTQEISDYFILTSPKGPRFKPAKALILNFVCAMAIVVGACATAAAEDMRNQDFGQIGAFVVGIYVHIATWDSLPRVNPLVRATGLRAICLLSFITGVVVVAVTLTDYEQCGPIDGNGMPSYVFDMIDSMVQQQLKQLGC